MTHLTKAHINYIIIRYHIMQVKITDIYYELKEERLEGEAVNKHGQTPITKLSKDYFYKKVHKIDEDTIELVKQEWCNDLLSIPLANKKVRINELVTLYNDEIDRKTKANLLKAIKEEVSEEKWQAAVKDSGTSPITLVSGLSVGMMKQIAHSVMEDSFEDIEEQAEVEDSDES